MKKISVILGFVVALMGVKSMEISSENTLNEDREPQPFSQVDNNVESDELKFEFQFDDINGTYSDSPQNVMVQYDSMIKSFRRKSDGVLVGYGSSLNKTRDQVIAGMSAAVQPFLDWVRGATKRYPELHTSAKLQEFTNLITTFTETTNQSIQAFTKSFYMNVEDTSKLAFDSFQQKGHEVLRDVLSVPATSSGSRRCKNSQLNRFGTLGSTAFRQVDGCINDESKLQRRIQTSSDIGLRNMRNYIGGIVSKLNFCYAKEFYEHPTQCIEKEVNAISVNEFVSFFINLTSEFDTGMLQKCTKKAKDSNIEKLTNVKLQVMSCLSG